MDKKDYVKTLWQEVYYMVKGRGAHPGPYAGHAGFLHLPPKFDEDLLNKVAGLSKLSGTELVNAVEQLRADFKIAEATGLIGHKDADNIYFTLDKIVG